MLTSYVEPFESCTSKAASEFIADNYDRVVRETIRMGLTPERAEDIVHDVYLSVVKSEDSGKGFDPSNYGKSENMTVENFVFGRIKRYSKNVRYRNHGAGVMEIPSTTSATDDLDTLDSFQKAYANASVYDDLWAVEKVISIREDIAYCLKMETVIGVNMVKFLGQLGKLTENVDKSIFSDVAELVKCDRSFAESLETLVEFASADKEAYCQMICEMGA